MYAEFNELKKATITAWQYDYGQKVRLVGTKAKAGMSMQWSYGGISGTDSRKIYEENGKLYAAIPNNALKTAGVCTGYIFSFDEDSGKTLYKLEVVVKSRASTDESTSEDLVPQWQRLILDGQALIHELETVGTSRLIETNKGRAIQAWVGTQAEYNEIVEYDSNMLYLVEVGE